MKLKSGKYILVLAGLTLIFSCSGPGRNYLSQDEEPSIFPDYSYVTVPVNISPLNFRLSGSEKINVIFAGKSENLEINGKDRIAIPLKKWRSLLKSSANDSLSVTVTARKDKKWTRYRPFNIYVRNEPVDPWIAYRLIAPGYESWSQMGIYQRDLTSFRSEPVITNRLLPGACMNCHSFRSNSPDDMMFHLRGNVGATMLVHDGKIEKLNTKVNETISNAVYPYWHPSGDYIAFSVNSIYQVFHSVSNKRIEVFDSKSDLVVYDIKNNKLITSSLISSENSFETFPAFSPDGKTLVFCSAKKDVQPDNYDKVKYSLCRVSFDASTGTFGTSVDTLISSWRSGKSVSFPRISPDGKFLVFTLSDYGNFSIWHREADLYLLDMATGAISNLSAVNSNETESYHSWSSDSRWLIFSSRRLDGLYTRLYIAYCDKDGRFSKPFLLPQKDPDYYDISLRSFNIPEFITGKVREDGRSMLKAIGSLPKVVTFERKD